MKPRRHFTTLALLFCLLTLGSCETKTEIVNSNFFEQYAGGRSIKVMKEETRSETFGIISKHKYTQDFSTRYEFIVSPGDHKWVGGIGQTPQKILFYQKDIFLKVVEENVSIDSLTSVVTRRDTTIYFKNNDNRFFFNLFGNQYFEPVPRGLYLDKLSAGKEENIPIM